MIWPPKLFAILEQMLSPSPCEVVLSALLSGSVVLKYG